ncbi:MAG: DNA-binding domain-containing protein [Gammaproteobacteria bacterium]|nr:DNA-binding domain-containing protein [Gammaproteobacteria bacterium]
MSSETSEMNSSPLKSLQQEMLSWLQEAKPQIKQSVTGTEKVSADTRLDIYFNAYRFRLIEALQETFPALHTLLGDEDFFNLGMEYLTANPSKHFSLRFFGHQMSSFLNTSEHFKDQPVLSEMAHFEWLLRDAFDAKNSEILNIEALQQIDPQSWPELKFVFHPTVHRVDLSFNTPQLWQAIDQEEPPIDIVKNEYPIAWCLWRKDLRTLYRSMDVDEAWAMDAMLSGHNFTDICSGVCEWVDEQHAAVRVAGFIQNWINEGMIQKVL